MIDPTLKGIKERRPSTQPTEPRRLRKKSSNPPKYRNPDNDQETWDGRRGWQGAPQWYRDWWKNHDADERLKLLNPDHPNFAKSKAQGVESIPGF